MQKFVVAFGPAELSAHGPHIDDVTDQVQRFDATVIQKVQQKIRFAIRVTQMNI
jgi:hypothetical protein